MAETTLLRMTVALDEKEIDIQREFDHNLHFDSSKKLPFCMVINIYALDQFGQVRVDVRKKFPIKLTIGGREYKLKAVLNYMGLDYVGGASGSYATPEEEAE